MVDINLLKQRIFALVEFDGKKGQRVKQILEIPIYIANRIPAR